VEGRAADDLELVTAVLGGDRQAYAALVGRYQRLVASVAWRYGTTRQEIEDVVSEVFLRAYRNLGRYRPEHPFSTWLWRLAANHVIDRGRRARRGGVAVELTAQLADHRAGPLEDADAGERAAMLHRALRALEPRYREVVFLVHLEGLRVDETARLLGLPEGTVKSRLSRGREALRRWLVEASPEHFGGSDALS
jgi:RNA polymerase sigma-70 factor (ECF subfamily)